MDHRQIPLAIASRPRTFGGVTSRPVIFISAVSSELGSARRVVQQILTQLGFDTDYQEVFGTEQGDLKAMLRRRIDASAGVIQIVGQRYGFAPQEPDPELGPVSYTHYEALYARGVGKKVWYLLLDDTFPPDAPAQESPEKAALQQAYRGSIRQDTHVYHRIADLVTLQLRVHEMENKLETLRAQSKRWSALVLALLLVLVVGSVGAFLLLHQQNQKQDQTTASLSELKKAQEDMRRALESSIKGGSGPKLQQDYDANLRFIAAQRGVSESSLRAFLDQHATAALGDPLVSLKDKIQALREAGQFTQARDFAVQHAKQMEADRTKASREEVELWTEAAKSETDLGHYDKGHDYAIKASGLADRAQDFITWSNAREQLGRALASQRHDAEAMALFQDLAAARRAQLGPEHPDTLRSRMTLAIVMELQGKPAEAEKEYHALLAVQQRVRGPEHADTLSTRMNLANALHEQGKYDEADAEIHAVLVIQQRTLGPEHPDTLGSRMNLATLLDLQGKPAEAETEHRAVLAIQERLLGPEHPDTLTSRVNLADALYGQRKYDEAGAEFHAILGVQQRVLGPEHPDTLSTRMNLVAVLDQQGKHAEAEAEQRAVLAIQERSLGPEHPDTLTSRVNLANALFGQQRNAEAEGEYRAVLPILKRVLGEDHPNTLTACSNLALCLERQDKKAEALIFAQQTLAGRQKTLGKDHPDTKKTQAMVDRLSAAK